MKKIIPLFIISYIFIPQTNLIGMQCFKDIKKKWRLWKLNKVINRLGSHEVIIADNYPETGNMEKFKDKIKKCYPLCKYKCEKCCHYFLAAIFSGGLLSFAVYLLLHYIPD